MEIDKSFPTVIVEQHNQQLRRHILWERGPLLGKGGFGSVYQGLSIATGELFAVKQVELPPDSIDARTKKVYFLNCRRSQALPMKLRS
jgi:serine/threonine protein kinase